MLMRTFQIARRDFFQLIRHPVTLVWAFVMPVVFFSFIGRMTSGFAPGPDRRDTIAILAPADAGFLAQALERRLNAAGYDVRRVAGEAELSKFSRKLRVPEAFTATAQAGKPQKIVFETSASGAGMDFDKIRLQRAVYGLLAETIGASTRSGALTESSMDETAGLSRNLTIEATAAGRRRTIPSGYQQAVPGILVMFILTVLLTSGGISIVAERNAGILRRLASSPMTRPAIVLTKWTSRATLAVVQTAVGAAIGTVVFKVDWGASLLAVAALLGAYMALCTSLSLWLGAAARSAGQASAIGVIAGNLLAALGGCWWPAEVSPMWMQKLSLALPTGITMNGLHRLMSFGDPAVAVLPHIAVLTGLALAAGWLASRSFRFE
ncbi:MAG: hypothetical protein C0504_02510 [Candidatus Solibacter sp.]|nr:hypothetical protein [Candidatus Solibacter sp.]